MKHLSHECSDQERGEYLAPQLERIELQVERGYLLSDAEIPDYGDEEEW